MPTGDYYDQTQLGTGGTVWYGWNQQQQTTYTTTWNYWNQVLQGTTATATTYQAQVWGYWNQQLGNQYTTTTVTINPQQASTAWVYWNELQAQSLGGPQRAPSAADLARMEQARERQAEILAKAKAERHRAMKLLREYLSEEQVKDLDEKGEFEVTASSGKRYAIRQGYAGNVFSLDERRRRIASHCIHPVDSVPEGDAMLAQLLWLKWNEQEFLRVANTTPMAA